MNLFVAREAANILYERVFLHPYYRHILLHYARNSSTRSFVLVFEGGIDEILRNRILADKALDGIGFEFESAASGESEESILNAPYGGGQFFRLRNKNDVAELRKKISEGIRMQALTPIAKHVNKRISLPLSRALARTRVSPNQITAFAFLFSIAGAALFFSSGHFVWAYLCFQINSILDGTDGEVARMNFKTSALGKKLDVYCDYATSALLLCGEFLGYPALDPSRASTAGSVAGMGILALIGLIWVAAVVARITPENFDDVETMCHARLKHPSTVREAALAALLFVSRRDFYILVAFLLSLAGCLAAAHFFLVFVCFAWFALSLYTLGGVVE